MNTKSKTKKADQLFNKLHHTLSECEKSYFGKKMYLQLWAKAIDQYSACTTAMNSPLFITDSYVNATTADQLLALEVPADFTKDSIDLSEEHMDKQMDYVMACLRVSGSASTLMEETRIRRNALGVLNHYKAAAYINACINECLEEAA